MYYNTQTNRVQAWQHVLPALAGDNQEGWPDWVKELAMVSRIEAMPDSSIHVYDASGRLLPLPLDYWLVFDEMTREISVVAPDRFATEYVREE